MNRKILLYLSLLVLSLFPGKSIARVFKVKEISILNIQSAITPATFDYLDHHFKNIPDESLILIKLNTPGGLVSTTKEIVTLFGSSPNPVAIWITPEGATAASAGAIIASGAHFIFMSPGTNLGAATPVELGSDIKESDGRKKSMNDLSAMVRALSDLRGRPSAPFENMIQDASSYTDREANQLQIIDGVLSRTSEIRKFLDQKTFNLHGESFVLQIEEQVRFKEYATSWGHKLLEVLTHPSTAYFLFLIGVALIYLEFQAPGGFIAGSVGFCFLVVAAIAFQVLPLNWGALGLIFLGVFLVILEIYITSFGLLFLVGLACFVMGSLFLFHDESGFISIEYPVIYSTLAGVLGGMGFIVWFLFKDRKNKRTEHFFLPQGSLGTILTKADPTSYQVKVRGEIWKAISSENLEIDDQVEVESVDQQKLVIYIKKSNLL